MRGNRAHWGISAPGLGTGCDRRAPRPTVWTRRLTTAASWPRLALGAILDVATFLNTFRLTREGYSNPYYAATVRSMLTSWHNFFFASYDPGGFVTVDKPPLGFWVQAASAKLFGFHGWSLLLPRHWPVSSPCWCSATSCGGCSVSRLGWSPLWCWPPPRLPSPPTATIPSIACWYCCWPCGPRAAPPSPTRVARCVTRLMPPGASPRRTRVGMKAMVAWSSCRRQETTPDQICRHRWSMA